MFPAWMQNALGLTKQTQCRKTAKFKPVVLALEERLTPANRYVDVSPTMGGTEFSPVGGANVAGLTPGVDIFTTVGAAVAAANSGDAILIANDPAPYIEPGNATIITAKSLDFMGIGSANPVLNNTVRRFFQLDGSNGGPVTQSLDRLTFTGGDTGGGIAVSAGFINPASVTITNATFVDNLANAGGAIGFGDGSVIVRSSSFTSNSAINNGGAISIGGGSLTLDGVTIGTSGNANSAPRGGGIAISGSPTVSFVNNPSTVQFNSATTSGGGVDLNSGAVTAVSLGGLLTVSNNQTTGNGSFGGGIAMRGAASASLTINGVVSANQANGDATSAGGGLGVSSGTVTIASTASIGGASSGNSTTGAGGGIAVTGGTINLLAGTSVTNNTAATSGGGILITGGTNHKITGSTLTGNSATNGGGISVAGGDVSFVTATTTVQTNQATQFGAGVDLPTGSTGTVIGSTFLNVLNNAITANNGHGAGVAVRGGAFSMTGGTIAGNNFGAGMTLATGGTGGGLYQNAGTVSLAGVMIGGVMAANTASDSGGGIHFDGGNSFSLGAGSSVIGNVAMAGGGGGLLFTAPAAGAAAITGTGPSPVIIRANQAVSTATPTSGSGGGILIALGFTGTLNIVEATIGGTTSTADGNTARRGGAIAKADAGNLKITNSRIVFNSATGTTAATDGGGGLLNVSGTTTLDPTVWNGNTSATNGGAMNVPGGTFVISAGDQFTNNSATLNGGAVNYAGGTGHTINSPVPGAAVIFANNTAGQNGGAAINVDILGGTLGISTTIFGGVPTGAGPGQSMFPALLGNAATSANGGAINIVTGNVTVARSTVGGVGAAGNSAGTNGGGIAVGGGAVTVDTSTIAGNSAVNGGGIATAGTLNLTGDTVAANTATTSTGGIRQTAGTLTVQNTLAGDNTGPPAGTDINSSGGTFVNAGNNLFETFAGIATAGTDVTGQDPVLAVLGNYGGPTPTKALLPGSPAIDKGTGASLDQRGAVVAGLARDIGAYESQGFNVTLTAPTSRSANVNSTFTPLSVTVAPKVAGEPVAGGIITFTANTALTGATATILGNVATIDPTGVATTGTVTANNLFGTYTVNVTTTGNFPPQPAPQVFTLTNLGVNTITFANLNGGAQPTNTRSGQPINGASGVIVQLIDQIGNQLMLAGVTVTVMVNTGPGALVPTATVSLATNAAGKAIFSSGTTPLIINTVGAYTLAASAPRNSTTPPANATTTSTAFQITASKLLFDPAPTPLRSAAAFTVTVRAVGEDNSLDTTFTAPIAVGINTFAATGAALPAPTLSGTTTRNAVAGIATFPGLSLDRGGSYTLIATSAPLTPGITGPIKVNANSIAVLSATAAGSSIFNTATGTTVMPPNSVRSSNQVSIVDGNKDILNVTVGGFDVTGQPADIAGNVSLTVNSAAQNRNGVVTPIVAPTVEGVSTVPAPATAVVFGQANHLTLSRWGDYILRATATDGLGFSTFALSGNVAVIARQMFIVNPPSLVVGAFTITTEARDVTGDVAQNFDGPADRTQVTVSNLAGGISSISSVDTGGQTSALVGNQIIAKKAPTRGVTIFNFTASRAIVSEVAVDEFLFFLDSTGGNTGTNAGTSLVNTLETGRRRPRPIPPVLIIPIAGTRVI